MVVSPFYPSPSVATIAVFLVSNFLLIAVFFSFCRLPCHFFYISSSSSSETCTVRCFPTSSHLFPSTSHLYPPSLVGGNLRKFPSHHQVFIVRLYLLRCHPSSPSSISRLSHKVQKSTRSRQSSVHLLHGSHHIRNKKRETETEKRRRRSREERSVLNPKQQKQPLTGKLVYEGDGRIPPKLML